MSGSNYTTTPNLGLFKPNYAADFGQWGTHLNANSDVLDRAVLPSNGGTVTGPLYVTATGSTASRSVQDRFAEVYNVLDHGADPTGVADSAPAFRACMGSNRRIVVPPGTYLFNSLLGVPSPYIATMPPCVLAEGLNNFAIEGYGATITLGTGGNRSTVFLFDRSNNFAVRGLTIQGSRTGLGTSSADPNVGITVMSCTNFVCEDLHLTGYYVYAFQGDWWVNGVIRDCTVDSAQYGLDVAYLYRCLIDHVDLTGSDLAGTGSGHVGNTGFSVIVDPNNAPYNYTGYAFSGTQHVTLRNNRASNFSTGCYFTTGLYWTLQGNRWQANPGAGSNIGVGLFISYDGTSGVGYPASDIAIHGDTFSNNGATTAGAGILFGNPSGSDFTSDVTIDGCLFDNNNNTGISLYLGSASNIRRLQSVGNTFSGASQTTSISATLLPVFTDVVGGIGYDLFGSGRVVSRLGGSNPSFCTYDGTTAVGMFISGGQLSFGPMTATGGPTASWGTWSGSGIAPSGGIIGTATNNNAAAGNVGEVISANVPYASNVVLPNSGTVMNIASISLTAGDWDISGEVWFNIGTSGSVQIKAAITTASATIPADSSIAASLAMLTLTLSGNNASSLTLRPCRASLAATTTYYLVAMQQAAGGVVQGFGSIIARRSR